MEAPVRIISSTSIFSVYIWSHHIKWQLQTADISGIGKGFFFFFYTGTGPFLVWDSTALRLLTIFFCGPVIVTPTFFKSLVCKRRTRERKQGERKSVIGLTEGGLGQKIQKTVLLLHDTIPWWQSVTWVQCCSLHFAMRLSLIQDCISQKAPAQPSLSPVTNREVGFRGYADSYYNDPVSGREVNYNKGFLY